MTSRSAQQPHLLKKENSYSSNTIIYRNSLLNRCYCPALLYMTLPMHYFRASVLCCGNTSDVLNPLSDSACGFYSDDIVPLRIPRPSERIDPPLVDVYIPHGAKDRRQINIAEAEAITDEVCRIASDPKFEKPQHWCRMFTCFKTGFIYSETFIRASWRGNFFKASDCMWRPAYFSGQRTGYHVYQHGGMSKFKIR